MIPSFATSSIGAPVACVVTSYTVSMPVANTTKEIATLLVISPRTVDRHRDSLLAKLQLRNRAELTRYAIRAGLIEP